MRKVALGVALVSALAVAGCGGTAQPATSSPAAAPPSASASPSTVASTVASTAISTDAGHGTHWSYEGDTGPAHWSEEYPTCGAAGQSPIDIDEAALVTTGATPVSVDFAPETTVTVQDTGHTIQADVVGGPTNSVTVGATTYNLKQFHFHATSEHQLDEANAPMELHLVGVNPADANDRAVLGVLLEPGEASTVLAPVFDAIAAMTADSEHASSVESAAPAAPITVDVTRLLPADLTVAQYQGSLTTPGCDEGVHWNVFLEPVTLSDEQIAEFTARYPDNSRPVQPLNGRPVVRTTVGG